MDRLNEKFHKENSASQPQMAVGMPSGACEAARRVTDYEPQEHSVPTEHRNVLETLAVLEEEAGVRFNCAHTRRRAAQAVGNEEAALEETRNIHKLGRALCLARETAENAIRSAIPGLPEGKHVNLNLIIPDFVVRVTFDGRD